jgi:sulfite reductase alpha subunit-like flavoprotein
VTGAFNFLVNEMTTDLPPLFILYGSATGNAEHISKELRDRANSLSKGDRFFSSVYCGELDSFKKKCLSTWESTPPHHKYPLIVVSSTTGNGEAPENANRFIRFIKKKPSLFMKHCSYCVLGLGDTNYENFCNVGKILDKYLEEVGGTRVMKLACADEAIGLEDTVEPWKQQVFAVLKEAVLGSEKKCEIQVEDMVDDVVPNEVTKEKLSKENPELPCEKNGTFHPQLPSSQGAVHEEDINYQSASSTNRLNGVRLLSQVSIDNSIPPLETITIDPATLPTLGPSRSLAEIVANRDGTLSPSYQEDHCKMTITSGSTAAFYTMYHPFDSTILSARYLSQTKLQGAQAASSLLYSSSDRHQDSLFLDTPVKIQKLYNAMEQLSLSFPLDIPNNDKRVVELTLSLPNPAFDINDHAFDYQPGDAIGIIIPNLPHYVLTVLSMLQTQHNVLYNQLVRVDEGRATVTVLEAVLYHMDLQSIPKKRILFGLAQHAFDETEKTALLILSSKTPYGEMLYESFVSKNSLAIGDLFALFSSCKPSLEALLAILPSLPPRYYSVCCSPLEQMDERKPFVRIAFAAVDYEAPHLGRKFGMATRYLETIASPLLAGEPSFSEMLCLMPKVKVFSRYFGQAIGTEFHLPSNLNTPLILIGPGTGIAPFIGFLSHRKYQLISAIAQQKDRSGSISVSEGTWRGGYEIVQGDLNDCAKESMGEIVNFRTDDESVSQIDVFYGCRCSTHDFIYRKEMEEFQEQGIISNFITAFSREGNQKVYVQNRMKEDAVGARLSQLILEKSAAVYICGDGNDMVKDVQSALVEILSVTLNNEAAARGYLNEMKEKRRLLIDVWT